MNSLPDEILLRVFALIEPAKSSWLDPTHARPDMLAEDELETAASLARIARVSRRFCRLVDSFGWVVIGYSRDLRKKPAKRLAVQVYDDVQLQATSLSDTWLKDGVVAATVVLQYPFQQGFPVKIHPFPVPELYGFALRELNLLGGATSCIEGSWLEPFLRETPSLETLRLTHVDRPIVSEDARNLSLTTLQTGCYYSGDVIFLQGLLSSSSSFPSNFSSSSSSSSSSFSPLFSFSSPVFSSGTQRLRNLHLTDIPRRLHDRSVVESMGIDDEWRTNLGRVLRDVAPNLETLTYLGFEPERDPAEQRALSHILPHAKALERLVTGSNGFTASMLELLAELPHLKYLRLVRSAHTPATDTSEHVWTFAELAEQIAALLTHPEREPHCSLRIDVEVRGSLHKYDCAQRTARTAFEETIMADGVEVWLLYYPDRPYKAYPAL